MQFTNARSSSQSFDYYIYDSCSLPKNWNLLWSELVPAILGYTSKPIRGYVLNIQTCECHLMVTRLAPRRGARKGIKAENSLTISILCCCR